MIFRVWWQINEFNLSGKVLTIFCSYGFSLLVFWEFFLTRSGIFLRDREAEQEKYTSKMEYFLTCAIILSRIAFVSVRKSTIKFIILREVGNDLFGRAKNYCSMGSTFENQCINLQTYNNHVIKNLMSASSLFKKNSKGTLKKL